MTGFLKYKTNEQAVKSLIHKVENYVVNVNKYKLFSFAEISECY